MSATATLAASAHERSERRTNTPKLDPSRGSHPRGREEMAPRQAQPLITRDARTRGSPAGCGLAKSDA